MLHEFRIPLPLTVAEFHVGQLYMTAEASKSATAGAEGVVWLKNEPYDNTDGHLGTSPITNTPIPRNRGQYTLKQLHFASKLPAVLRALAPAKATYLIEEAWNAYPHCVTVLVSAYLAPTTLRIEVESMHVDGDIDAENAVRMPPAELKRRVVEYLDVRAAFPDKAAKDYSAAHDLSVARTSRSPLEGGWERAAVEGRPLMCCYKCVRVTANVFPLSGTICSTIENQQRSLFAKSLAQAAATVDAWKALSLDDVRKLEAETAAAAAAAAVGDAPAT